jgi:hypothetical protein
MVSRQGKNTYKIPQTGEEKNDFKRKMMSLKSGIAVSTKKPIVQLMRL